MRTHLLGQALLVTLMLIGCNGAEVPLGSDSAEAAGLMVRIQAPKTTFLTGEEFKVVVVARNTTHKPMRIDATTGAPVYLRIWRHTGLGWQQVRRYPQVATMVMNPWTLKPRSERRFELNLVVEPDWPTNEALLLTAELNARGDVVPSIFIGIVPRAPTAE